MIYNDMELVAFCNTSFMRYELLKITPYEYIESNFGADFNRKPHYYKIRLIDESGVRDIWSKIRCNEAEALKQFEIEKGRCP